MDNKELLWEKCAAFHGHVCGGLAIGYQAALYALQLLELPYDEAGLSPDEQLVCISENDACGVDAIQVILSCTVGKGNLLFHLRGKQAFSFYHRASGRSVRLVLRPRPQGLSREDSLEYYRSHKPEELFEVRPATLPLPEPARLFDSYVCEGCGEVTGANWIRIANGKKLCLDCCPPYDRFSV